MATYRSVEQVCEASLGYVPDFRVAEALATPFVEQYRPTGQPDLRETAKATIFKFLQNEVGSCFDVDSLKDEAVQALIMHAVAKAAGWEKIK